jgi:acyl-CoA thioesterase-1
MSLVSAGAYAADLPHVAARIAAGAPVRIIAFGSSSTEGVGASNPAATYPARLQRELGADLPRGAEVTNRGVGGEDVDDMMARLPGIIAEHPDLVIWQTGTNDPLRDVKLDHFIELTAAGVKAMRDAGIDVMLMEPQLCRALSTKDAKNAFRDAVRKIATDAHVPVVRRYSMMVEWLQKRLLTEVQLLSPDGLHMADAGYAMLARKVADAILREAGAPAKVIAAK